MEIQYLRGAENINVKKKLIRFLLDAMLSYAMSTEILTKISRSRLRECDYHKLQQYSDQK